MTFLAHTADCWLAVWNCTPPEFSRPLLQGWELLIDNVCCEIMIIVHSVPPPPMGSCITMRVGTDRRKQAEKKGMVWVDAEMSGLCQVLDVRINRDPYSVATAQHMHHKELPLPNLSVYLLKYRCESSLLSGHSSERSQCSVSKLAQYLRG